MISGTGTMRLLYRRYSDYYSDVQDEATARDRLLLAAAEVLDESGGTASTRAICERAGVTAPTLYHHFGSKQRLIDEVINYGIRQYLTTESSGDPVADVRRGWDAHVRYGLENPSFYVLLHGRIKVGVPCGVTGPAQETLGRLLTEAARQGLLTVPVADATAQILAANVGVTLSLIGQSEEARDQRLSHAVREAVLANVFGAPSPAASSPTGRGRAAVTLRSALADDPSGLTPGEAALLAELLDRIAVGGR
jgi:AcrR family transcriptional regulator